MADLTKLSNEELSAYQDFLENTAEASKRLDDNELRAAADILGTKLSELPSLKLSAFTRVLKHRAQPVVREPSFAKTLLKDVAWKSVKQFGQTIKEGFKQSVGEETGTLFQSEEEKAQVEEAARAGKSEKDLRQLDRAGISAQRPGGSAADIVAEEGIAQGGLAKEAFDKGDYWMAASHTGAAMAAGAGIAMGFVGPKAPVVKPRGLMPGRLTLDPKRPTLVSGPPRQGTAPSVAPKAAEGVRVSAEKPPAKPVSPADVPVTKKPAAAQAKIDATVEAGKAAGRGAQEVAKAVDEAAAKKPVARGAERRVRKEPVSTGKDRRTGKRRAADQEAQLKEFEELVKEHKAPELLLDETRYGFAKDPKYRAVIEKEVAKRPTGEITPKDLTELTPAEMARKEAVARLKKQHETLKARKAEAVKEDPGKLKARRKQAKVQVERMDTDFAKLYTKKGAEVPLDSLARRNEFAKRAGLTERSQGSYAKEAPKPAPAKIPFKAKPAEVGPKPKATVLEQWGRDYLKSRKQKKSPPPEPEGIDVSGLRLEIDAKIGKMTPEAAARKAAFAKMEKARESIPGAIRKYFARGAIRVDKFLESRTLPEVRATINKKYPGAIFSKRGIPVEELARDLGVDTNKIISAIDELAAADAKTARTSLPIGEDTIPRKGSMYVEEMKKGDHVLTADENVFKVMGKRGDKTVLKDTMTGEEHLLSPGEEVPYADFDRPSMTVLRGGTIDPQTGVRKTPAAKSRLASTLKKSAARKKTKKSPAVAAITAPEAGETAGIIKRTLGKVKGIGEQLDDMVSQRFNNVRRIDDGAADVFTRAEAAENHGVMRSAEVMKGLKREMGRRAYKQKRHKIVEIYMEEAARDLDTKGIPNSYPRLEQSAFDALMKDPGIKSGVKYLKDKFVPEVEALSLEGGIDPAKFIKVPSGLYFQLKALTKTLDPDLQPHGYAQTIKLQGGAGGGSITRAVGKKYLGAGKQRAGGKSITEWEGNLDNMIQYAYRARIRKVELNQMRAYLKDTGLKLKSGEVAPEGYAPIDLAQPVITSKGRFTIADTVYVPKEIKLAYEHVITPTANRNYASGELSSFLRRWGSFQTGLALAVPAEAVSHTINFMGALVGMKNLGQIAGGKVGKAALYIPGTTALRLPAAFVEMMSITRKSPHYFRIREYLSKYGGLRATGFESYKYTGRSKIVHAVHVPFKPMRQVVFGLDGIETRARVAWARLFELSDPKATHGQIALQVNKAMGAYVNRLAPPLVTMLKKTMLDPFATAGIAITSTAVKALFGYDIAAGGFSAASIYQITVNSLMSWAIYQKMADRKNRWPWEIPGSRLGEVIIEQEGGRRAVSIPFRLWAPLTARGLGATGLRQLYDAHGVGENKAKEMARDVANTMMSRIGPPGRVVMETLAERVPYFTRSGDLMRNTPPGKPFETTAEYMGRKGKAAIHAFAPVLDPLTKDKMGARPESKTTEALLSGLELFGIAPKIIPGEKRRKGGPHRTQQRILYDNADYWGFKAVQEPTIAAGIQLIIKNSKNVTLKRGTRARWMKHAIRNLISAQKSKHKSAALVHLLGKMGLGGFVSPEDKHGQQESE